MIKSRWAGRFRQEEIKEDYSLSAIKQKARIANDFQPLDEKTEKKFDIVANVFGGGLSGQAGAIRLGIARALQTLEPKLRDPLKKAGMLTRDSREVERKKYGRSGARKRYQFSKR